MPGRAVSLESAPLPTLNKSVILCQQRIACPPYGGTEVTKKLNGYMQFQQPNTWDGYLWPFGKIQFFYLSLVRMDLTPADLLIAFGYALARTRNTKDGSAKIQIVLATHKKKGNRND